MPACTHVRSTNFISQPLGIHKIACLRQTQTTRHNYLLERALVVDVHQRLAQCADTAGASAAHAEVRKGPERASPAASCAPGLDRQGVIRALWLRLQKLGRQVLEGRVRTTCRMARALLLQVLLVLPLEKAEAAVDECLKGAVVSVVRALWSLALVHRRLRHALHTLPEVLVHANLRLLPRDGAVDARIGQVRDALPEVRVRAAGDDSVHVAVDLAQLSLRRYSVLVAQRQQRTPCRSRDADDLPFLQRRAGVVPRGGVPGQVLQEALLRHVPVALHGALEGVVRIALGRGLRLADGVHDQLLATLLQVRLDVRRVARLLLRFVHHRRHVFDRPLNLGVHVAADEVLACHPRDLIDSALALLYVLPIEGLQLRAQHRSSCLPPVTGTTRRKDRCAEGAAERVCGGKGYAVRRAHLDDIAMQCWNLIAMVDVGIQVLRRPQNRL